MKLCIDVGNSRIYCGIFDGDKISSRFRKATDRGVSSDELGLFLRQAIRENGQNPDDVMTIGFCSVVPDLNHALVSACTTYFGIEPFILKAGVKTGLKIRYKNPAEVGADRIADAIGAMKRHPNTNLIIMDFGTATTVEAVNSQGEYLGGAIIPGIRIGMLSLESNTAQLPKVDIRRPERVCGRSTAESIQSGLYWGHFGMIKEMRDRIHRECFKEVPATVIATGGFAELFQDTELFDVICPDLTIEGIRAAQEANE
ncbi:MAG: type III pantothenate kinase [Spirochaetales bacterium]|jgi:type III pantothenate kinase|nr:type III pantothenate kinase [Spirochaetales bacterium]